MDKEISQEAQASLAALREQQAHDRLRRAGAFATPAMQRRLRALAAERSIPPTDYANLLHKRVSTGAFLAFCEKHNVSTDWLLMGDLKGLHRMTQNCTAQPPVLTPEQFRAGYAQLPPEMQKIIAATISRLLEQRK